ATWAAGRGLSLDQAIAEARADDVLGRAAKPAPPAPRSAPLTPREREVAALLARGLTNRQIAEALVISERTADNHVSHILDKLGFASRAQVAAWAVAQGLAAPPLE